MRITKVIPLFVVGTVAACGGGGGDSGGTTNPPPPATVNSVSLTRTNVLLKPTETTTITATPKDASGNTLSGHTVTWTVLPATGVAGITPNGASVTISGTANGTATVTATSDTKTADVHVTVSSAIPTAADVDVGANGNNFTPADTDILSGGSVTFAWHGVTHNVTWLTTPASVANITDRSTGSVGVTLNQAGTYNYHCTIHPGMDGTVTVH
jgi:plastocyanin